MKTKLFIVMAIAIIALACIACKNDESPPLVITPTITKRITVPAINNPTTDPLNFGAVSSLTGWDADFPSSDVTYTLTLSQNGVIKRTVISTSATSISGSGLSDGQYTITQTFSYSKGNIISGGSRSAGVVIAGNAIGGIIVDENTLTAGSLIQLTLTLSKPIQ